MLKHVLLARFEPVVMRFGPWKNGAHFELVLTEFSPLRHGVSTKLYPSHTLEPYGGAA